MTAWLGEQRGEGCSLPVPVVPDGEEPSLCGDTGGVGPPTSVHLTLAQFWAQEEEGSFTFTSSLVSLFPKQTQSLQCVQTRETRGSLVKEA